MKSRNKDQQAEPCWGRADQAAAALRIELSGLEQYVFPYTELSYAHRTKETDNDTQTLTIHYTDFIVTITGKQLEDILFNLQKQNLEWIKVSDVNHQSKNRSPTITSIKIEPVSEPKIND